MSKKEFLVDGFPVWVEDNNFEKLRKKFKENVAVDNLEGWESTEAMEKYTATTFLAKARYYLSLKPPDIMQSAEKAWFGAVYEILRFFSDFAIDCSSLPFERRSFLRYSCWGNAEKLHQDVYGSGNFRTSEYSEHIQNIEAFVTTFSQLDRAHLFQEFRIWSCYVAMTSIYILVVLVLASTVYSSPTKDKCLSCKFLVETFKQGLKNTANKHFAGGDTAWEEKNLGKYATSETRLIEVLESVCKRKTLSGTDHYSGVKELEFKCSHLLEEREETVEEWYYNHQQEDMESWLCVNEFRACCKKGHYGATCKPCPGVKEGAEACFGNGECDGDGIREGVGKCKCNKGYDGQMCRQCAGGWYPTKKTETKVECAECFKGCAGGCTGPSAAECRECKAGYQRNDQNECSDVDECAVAEACTKPHEMCVNTEGSYRCDCEVGHVRTADGECELDVTASPSRFPVRPDLFLRCVSIVGLFIAITLVVWRRSVLLFFLSAVTVLLFIVIELYVNPDAVPEEVKKHFEL